MDISSLIMGLFLLALFTLPFILVSRSNSKEKDQLLNRLNELAKQHHTTIAKHDTYGNLIIGSDENTTAVFFIKHTDEKEIEQSVKLAEVQKCTMLNTIKSLNGKENNGWGQGKLALSFQPVTKGKNEILLEFYHESSRNQLGDELILLNKWNEIISQKLRR